MKLIEDDWVATDQTVVNNLGVTTINSNAPFEDSDLAHLWDKGVKADGEFRDIRKALVQEERCFPPSITSKISISECSINNDGFARWRN